MRISLGPLTTLTDRELEVLTWTAMGLTNAEIAKELFISTETVKSHMRHIFDKLEARSRANAVFIAASHGWLTINSKDDTWNRSRQSLYE